MNDDRRHCVVLLTGSECEAYPGKTCVMEVLGPYTRAEADEVFARQPEWTCPHRMTLHRDYAGMPDAPRARHSACC